MKFNQYIKRHFIDILSSVIDAAIIILFHFPIYQDKAVLCTMDEEGECVTKTFYYPKTPLERLNVLNLGFLLYIGYFLFAVSILLILLSFLLKKAKFNKIKNFFCVFVSFFLIFLILFDTYNIYV
jgi:hypothetical protein